MLNIKLIKDIKDLPESFSFNLDLSKDLFVYLLFSDDEMIGCGQLIEHNFKEIEIAYIEIRKEYRKRGYGTKLIKFMINNSHYKEFLLTTVEPSFYEKIGFKKIRGFPSFVDHSDPECKNCNPSKCVTLSYKKPDGLIKLEESKSFQAEYAGLLKRNRPMICEFSLINNKLWSFTENPYFLKIKDYLFIVSFPFDNPNHGVVLPYKNIPLEVMDIYILFIKKININRIKLQTNITDLPRSLLEKINEINFSSKHPLEIIEDRDNFDYLYRVSDFACYPGRKYSKKRNRLKKFIKNYPNFTILPYDSSYKSEVLEFAKHINKRLDVSYIYGELPLKIGLDSNLLSGFIVKVAEKIVGLVLYSILNEKTVLVHFELINTNYDGVAQFINNYMAKTFQGKYLFINREQDLGISGLRKSKLSYKPYRLLKKYDIVFK